VDHVGRVFGDDMFRRIIADMLDEASPPAAPVTPQ
jgi:hypothetical protein